MDDHTIYIRKATPEDALSLLKLVKELADYEKAPNEVKTTESDFISGLENRTFDCLIAENEQGVVGMALYFSYFSTWNGKTLYLEDFIVQQNMRGRGIGKLLFNAFLEEARRQKVYIVKWQVLDWNSLAIDFYKKYGTVFYEGWKNGVIRITDRP